MANLNIANRNEHRLMKTIRQTLILLTFALFFAANVTAAPLDERQRTVETVVADALAQLPAATAGDYDKIMGELAATGAEGVGILADMRAPPYARGCSPHWHAARTTPTAPSSSRSCNFARRPTMPPHWPPTSMTPIWATPSCAR